MFGDGDDFVVVGGVCSADAVCVVVYGAEGGGGDAEFVCEGEFACDGHADNVGIGGEALDFGTGFEAGSAGLEVGSAECVGDEGGELLPELGVDCGGDVVDVVVVQGGDEPGGVVVVGDDEGAGAVGLFHAAGAADEDEPVDAEDFAGGEVGFVVDVVGRGVFLVTGDEDEGAPVEVGAAEGGCDGLFVEWREFGCEECGSADDA